MVTYLNRKRSATDFVSLHEVRREVLSGKSSPAGKVARAKASFALAASALSRRTLGKVLDLESAARETGSVKIWVYSAGYGLIAIDEPLVPYAAATFAPGHDDSVCADAEERRKKWWQGLTSIGSWELALGVFKDLVESEPGARFLLSCRVPICERWRTI